MGGGIGKACVRRVTCECLVYREGKLWMVMKEYGKVTRSQVLDRCSGGTIAQIGRGDMKQVVRREIDGATQQSGEMENWGKGKKFVAQGP